MKKDDIFNVAIEDITSEGAGIGKVDGFPLFIKDAVIGDTVEAKVMKAKKNYAYARLMKVLKPSEDRVDPPCPVARQCGGCQIQAMSYEAELRFKEKKILNNLKRIGGFEGISLEPIIGMKYPYRYRNKAQFPIGETKRAGSWRVSMPGERTASSKTGTVSWVWRKMRKFWTLSSAGWRSARWNPTTRPTEQAWFATA